METIESMMIKGAEELEAALFHLSGELTKIRAGKASTSMLSGVMVDYYGHPTPLPQVSSLNTPDSRTISIQPWEKSMLGPIEKAIFASNLGLTPMNDGEFVRISIPPLTEERRKDLVKQAKALGEEAKISLRNTRHKVMDFIKKEVKDGYPEDAGKKRENEVQELITEYTKKVDKMIELKEKDIMTV
ncbi:MAG TPA: ribosome recycling factor [Saprospiraceae bacterium]|nr:ribosome recycling factor [Saprospiraceae bacterium]